MIDFRRAQIEEIDKIVAFYENVADVVQFADFHPGWQRGLYPRRVYIKESIEKGTLYLGFDAGNLIGGAILDHEAPAGYEKGHWSQNMDHVDVLFVHTFAVSPDHQGKGYGKKMIEAMKTLAQEKNIAALRLDVLKDYDRAKALYESTGFRTAGLVELFYDDVGWKTFRLYENIL